MSRSYKYAVAQFSADRGRDERLNLGIIVISDDGLDVRLPRSLDKVRAISAALSVDAVRDALEQLPAIDSYILEQGLVTAESRIAELSQLGPLRFSALGEFVAASTEQYERSLQRLLTALVEPEPAPAREVQRRPTKLLADVKSAFKAERVLARKGEGLETHRIVTNHKVAEGLPADLILKNGAMHVIQTVDASSIEASPKRMITSIAISALVFEQARMNFGENGTTARLVYKASSSYESMISPSLEAAEHQGATLINWESRDDRTRFVVEISGLADPVADTQPHRRQDNLHASVQPKFRLN